MVQVRRMLESLDSSVRRVPVQTVVLGVLAGLITGIIADLLSGVLVLGGAILSSLGFIALKSFVNKYLPSDKARVLPRAIILYLLRLVLICLVFLIIIFYFKNKVLAFAAGFSLVLVSVAIEAVRNLAGVKKWKD